MDHLPEKQGLPANIFNFITSKSISMKKFLIFGAVLMVGASIYGFVDYSKTKHSKRFNNLYREAEVKEAAVQPAGADEKSLTEVKTEPSDLKKEAVKNSNVSKPAIIKKPVKQKIQKPRKFSYKEFSRAPLKENIIEKTIKTEEPKKQSMKTKEQ